jgi:hypothetical protein
MKNDHGSDLRMHETGTLHTLPHDPADTSDKTEPRKLSPCYDFSNQSEY